MKLWLLEAKEDLSLWEPWYDKMFSLVVRASSPKHARVIASNAYSDETPLAWLNADNSTCKELNPEGKQGVVITNVWSA